MVNAAFALRAAASGSGSSITVTGIRHVQGCYYYSNNIRAREPENAGRKPGGKAEATPHELLMGK
jgi:hypothetical protein